MNEKTKFATLLIVVVLASVVTSYVTNLALYSNTASENGQQGGAEESSTSKIFPEYEVSFSPRELESTVLVSSGVPVKNLTIEYRCTSLNGTTYTKDITYGDYYPHWSPNHEIEPDEIPFQYYRIPDSIIFDCGTTKGTFDNQGRYIGPTWDIYPRIDVTVCGYS